jgi:hypothetical protein
MKNQNHQMKKQLANLLLFLFTFSFAWSQGRFVKTTTPRDNGLVKKTPGGWMPISKSLYIKFQKSIKRK